MNKFCFSLDTVLRYKGQILDNLKNEQAQILSKVARKEKLVKELEEQAKDWAFRFDFSKAQGASISDIKLCEGYLYSLHGQVKREKQELQVLIKQEKLKRVQVIEAKKETTSIEKLREKKQGQYNKEMQKREETFIEEFVTNTRMSNKH